MTKKLVRFRETAARECFSRAPFLTVCSSLWCLRSPSGKWKHASQNLHLCGRSFLCAVFICTGKVRKTKMRLLDISRKQELSATQGESMFPTYMLTQISTVRIRESTVLALRRRRSTTARFRRTTSVFVFPFFVRRRGIDVQYKLKSHLMRAGGICGGHARNFSGASVRIETVLGGVDPVSLLCYSVKDCECDCCVIKWESVRVTSMLLSESV